MAVRTSASHDNQAHIVRSTMLGHRSDSSKAVLVQHTFRLAWGRSCDFRVQPGGVAQRVPFIVRTLPPILATTSFFGCMATHMEKIVNEKKLTKDK